MTDLASLNIAVNSTEVFKGTAALEGLTGAGEAAAKAYNELLTKQQAAMAAMNNGTRLTYEEITALGGYAAVIESVDKNLVSVTSKTNEYSTRVDRLFASVNQYSAAQQTMNNQLTEAQKLLEAGALTLSGFAAATGAAIARFETAASGMAGTEQNLARLRTEAAAAATQAAIAEAYGYDKVTNSARASAQVFIEAEKEKQRIATEHIAVIKEQERAAQQAADKESEFLTRLLHEETQVKLAAERTATAVAAAANKEAADRISAEERFVQAFIAGETRINGLAGRQPNQPRSIAFLNATDLASNLERETGAVKKLGIETLNTTVVYEGFVLVHELLSGRVSRMPTSLLIMGQAAAGSATEFLKLAVAFSPLIGILALVGTAIAAITNQVKNFQTATDAIHGVGAEAGLTAISFGTLAREAVNTGNVSISAARGMEAAMLHAGVVSAETLRNIIQYSETYARVTGQDVAEANRELATSLADPARGVETLNHQLNLLDGAETEHINQLVRTGQLEEAQVELSRRVADALASQTNQVDNLADGWSRAARALGNYWDQLGNLLNPSVSQQMADQDRADRDRLNNPFARFMIGPEGVAAAQARVAAYEDYQRNAQAATNAAAAQGEHNRVSREAYAAVEQANPSVGRRNNLLGEQARILRGINEHLFTGERLQQAQTALDVIARRLREEDRVEQGLPRRERQRHNTGRSPAQTFEDGTTAQLESARAALTESDAALSLDANLVVLTAHRKADTEATRAGMSESAAMRREVSETQLAIANIILHYADEVSVMRVSNEQHAMLNARVAAGTISQEQANQRLQQSNTLRDLQNAIEVAHGDALNRARAALEAYNNEVRDTRENDLAQWFNTQNTAIANQNELLNVQLNMRYASVRAREVEIARVRAYQELAAKDPNLPNTDRGQRYIGDRMAAAGSAHDSNISTGITGVTQQTAQLREQQTALLVQYAAGEVGAEEYSLALSHLAHEQAILATQARGGNNFANIMRASLLSLRDTGTTVTRGLINSFSGFFNSLKNGFADSVAHSIVYADSLGAALRDVARSAVAELISGLIKLGIQWVINHTIGLGLATAATATSTAMAGTLAAAWATPAAFVSVATMGSADAIGAAGLASTVALAQGLAAATGKFANGGPVSGPGGPRDDRVNAWLSDGEYVINADAARKNRRLLDAINGGMNISNDNHFANGGPVGRGGSGNTNVFNFQGANFGGSNPEEIEKRFRKVMQEEYTPAILQEADKNTQKRVAIAGRQRLNGARM